MVDSRRFLNASSVTPLKKLRGEIMCFLLRSSAKKTRNFLVAEIGATIRRPKISGITEPLAWVLMAPFLSLGDSTAHCQ